MAGLILDATTGTALAGDADKKTRNRATPNTRHLLLIAAGQVYGLREGKGSETQAAQTGVCEVYSLEGKPLAESVLTCAPAEGDKKRQIIEVHGYNTWPWSYGCSFTIAGRCLYVRGSDYLYCIGPPVDFGKALTHCDLAIQ